MLKMTFSLEYSLNSANLVFIYKNSAFLLDHSVTILEEKGMEMLI